MDAINVMVSGLPGAMGQIICRTLGNDPRFRLLPASLTGPGIPEGQTAVDGKSFSLVAPENHEKAILSAKKEHGSILIVDYTHPSAVNRNAELYCRLSVPFVMGTTGGDRDALVRIVQESGNTAVIAPNMAREIVGLTAMMKFAAASFPGLFSGYKLTVTESHQKTKADTSGTAKELIGLFQKMGASFSPDDLHMVREEKSQREMGIPEAYLGGHGWHTYRLESQDGTVSFAFTHNVNGRNIYGPGTADAAVFLAKKLAQGVRGQAFSMVDVMSGK
ncbi:MAG: dihydrodipicolinate reductase [Thermodesulfobacteriota bacterium]